MSEVVDKIHYARNAIFAGIECECGLIIERISEEWCISSTRALSHDIVSFSIDNVTCVDCLQAYIRSKSNEGD